MGILKIPRFLDKETCKKIIISSRKKYSPCTTVGEDHSAARIAECYYLNISDSITKVLFSKLESAIKIKKEHFERPNIVKYLKGGEYKLHFDYVFESKYELMHRTQHIQSGQRIKTFLIYLNDNFTGGETDFPRYNTKIKPETGLGILWDNVNADGKLDINSLHAGLPVKKGIKHILVIWIRHNPILDHEYVPKYYH